MIPENNKIVTTSIRVNEETWKKTKIKAIQQGMTVTAFLNKALEDKL